MVNGVLISTVLASVIVFSIVGAMILPSSAASVTVGKTGSYKAIQGSGDCRRARRHHHGVSRDV